GGAASWGIVRAFIRTVSLLTFLTVTLSDVTIEADKVGRKAPVRSGALGGAFDQECLTKPVGVRVL
ncbi:hypothetical protein BTH42_25490, partial [Burkholderia sp. SRS-W-2-2016]|uniref:hypothetical protein n=1 Tax=Burkholderia sp. SRS-W-2-2016 TaxID=1926878 RepID=UPI000967B3B6